MLTNTKCRVPLLTLILANSKKLWLISGRFFDVAALLTQMSENLVLREKKSLFFRGKSKVHTF